MSETMPMMVVGVPSGYAHNCAVGTGEQAERWAFMLAWTPMESPYKDVIGWKRGRKEAERVRTVCWQGATMRIIRQSVLAIVADFGTLGE